MVYLPAQPATPRESSLESHAEAHGFTWDGIVREHSARVYRLSLHLTGNPHDAEDLTQDVFVRVFNSLSQYKPGTFELSLIHI